MSGPVEWMRIDGYCPFLTCLVDGPHEHPVCPECGAVRYGNLFCGTCGDLRAGDLNPHRLVPPEPAPCRCPCSCWSASVDSLCDACRMNIHAGDRPRPRPVAVKGAGT